MRILPLLGVVVYLAAAGTNGIFASSNAPAADAHNGSEYQSVINRYCVTCHNQKLRTADLSLDKADLANAGRDAAVWEKVIRKLRTKAMPPVGVPRPDDATYQSLAAYLETALDQYAISHPNTGRTSAHRLNRAEYTNAIRDLLGLEFDASTLLPPDDSSYGFDNIGEVLTVSPLLLERYMAVARRIARLAVGNVSSTPTEQIYNVPRYLRQEDRMSEELPFGSRGGIATRHFFPVDAEYVVKVRLKRSYDGAVVLGILDRPYHIELRLDGKEIKDFTIGGEGVNSGPILRPSGYGEQNEKAPQATATNIDANLQVRLPVKAGTHLIGVAFVKQYVFEPEGVLRPWEIDLEDEPSIGSVAIDGPYGAMGPSATESRRLIFTCHPPTNSITSVSRASDQCAKKILAGLARRAYRHPVTDQDVQPLLSLFHRGMAQGGFDSGIETALRGILSSPDFLFRIERDPPGVQPDSPYQISDCDLASRLSFFLWSSLPDETLMRLADQSELHHPAVLEQQVQRMLADSRSQSLVQNFAGQWLYIRNLQKIVPDPKEFPDFDENLRQAMQHETELLFGSMLHEDRSILSLLDADYTFLNERLARHYGLNNIYGSHFRRVTIRNENRRGLLGQASILTVTSYANRTSPTLRGKWLLENILGSPPPPPPPNVPSLNDRGEDGKLLSIRQQMERHRKNPSCATCHARMDPLGFALENFDALGRWRDTSGAEGTPVDASGVLPDGTAFNGPAELRRILMSRADQFAIVVTEKLLTYALGRGLEFYDEPAVRRIVRAAVAENYRWSSIIVGIVNSAPFRMRMPRPQETTRAMR